MRAAAFVVLYCHRSFNDNQSSLDLVTSCVVFGVSVKMFT